MVIVVFVVIYVYVRVLFVLSVIDIMTLIRKRESNRKQTLLISNTKQFNVLLTTTETLVLVKMLVLVMLVMLCLMVPVLVIWW